MDAYTCQRTTYVELHPVPRDLHIDIIQLEERLINMSQHLCDPIIRL
jgi:hypothetical protein